jgi:putative membrane protein
MLSLLVSGLMLLPGYAQSSKSQSGKSQSSQQSGSNLSATDRTFLKKAAEGNMAEVEMGKLGQQKGTSSQVKQLADRLVNDHQQNQQTLQSLAQKEGVTLPTSVAPNHQALKARLEKLNGAAFDKAFATDAVREHHKDIAEFKRVESSTKNPDVKNYAAQTLPKLQEHLQLAQTAGGGTAPATHRHGKAPSQSMR